LSKKIRPKFKKNDRVIVRGANISEPDIIGKIMNIGVSKRTKEIIYLIVVEAVGKKIIKYKIKNTEFDPNYQGKEEHCIIVTTIPESNTELFSQKKT